MEHPFLKTLSRVEKSVEKLNAFLRQARTMAESGEMDMAFHASLMAADAAERTVLLARALPAYTGNSTAADRIEALTQSHIPVDAGFTAEGWFSVRLPLLLPKKETGSAGYVRSFLYPALREFFRGKPPVRYRDCVLIYRHVYSRSRPERKKRDHDNIESNMVSDIVALYVMEDDAPSLCSHYECSAAANRERTEVYVVPRQDFPVWLEVEKSMPEEGVILYENRP